MLGIRATRTSTTTKRRLGPTSGSGLIAASRGTTLPASACSTAANYPTHPTSIPIGVMNEFTTAHHVLDIGEEKPPLRRQFAVGHGLRPRDVAQHPQSRAARQPRPHPRPGNSTRTTRPCAFAATTPAKQGGLVIWCHNGRGMEAPVAAALGKLDAFNLFDPFLDGIRNTISGYKLLNCGLRLPASTWYGLVCVLQ